jgi:hypothetical protein
MLLDNACLETGIGGPMGGTAPESLTIVIEDEDAVLTWPGTGVLQNNSDLQGIWIDVEDGTATSPHTIEGPLKEKDFFRLR